jgi:hypothetical protein
MKKSFAIVTALAFLFMAWTPKQLYASDGPTFSVGSTGAVTSGENITVPITVSNNPGFTTAGLVVSYDPNVLEITGVTAPVASMPLNPQFSLTSTPGTQWVHLINTDLADWNGNGTVANVTFNAKTNAANASSAVSLSFTNAPSGTPMNAAGATLAGSQTYSGSVNVASNNTGGGTSGSGGGSGVLLSGSASNTDGNGGGSDNTNHFAGSDDTHPSDSSAPYNIVDGAFIGNPTPLGSVAADTAISTGTGADTTRTGVSNGAVSQRNGRNSNFGIVPQTNAPDILAAAAALCLSLAASVVLCVYIRRKYLEG